jgi:hypothetical protein
MFEDETLTADNISAQQPVVSSSSITQGHTFSADNITSSPPISGEPQFGLIYNFATGELISGVPIIPIILYDAALGRIATEAESQSFVELTMKSSNRCVINSKPNKVELVA